MCNQYRLILSFDEAIEEFNRTRIYIPDLHINSIGPKTRDLR